MVIIGLFWLVLGSLYKRDCSRSAVRFAYGLNLTDFLSEICMVCTNRHSMKCCVLYDIECVRLCRLFFSSFLILLELKLEHPTHSLSLATDKVRTPGPFWKWWGVPSNERLVAEYLQLPLRISRNLWCCITI